jgi:alkylation response protein AidB-like acyl-CoA dehydrogenase
MSTGIDDVRQRLQPFAARLVEERDARRKRTLLDGHDFDSLADAGYLLTGVPAAMGGLWNGPARSARGYCGLVRDLACGDPSLALVATMHPAVLAFWLSVDEVDRDDAGWQAQRRELFESALTGHWWGTIISEPGSGGDPMRTRTTAQRDAAGWRLSGEKHFGSGSGMTSFMITTARAEGEDQPDLFIIDMRDRPWDASAGLELRRAWDGYGMMATQSHAFLLDACPATRAASPDGFARAAPEVAQLTPLLFTAVILGILDAATAAAQAMVAPKWRQLRPYEQVAWTQGSNQCWLAEQAFEGALRAVEGGRAGALAAARCKLLVAELSESALALLARVIGGGSFSQSLPFGQWSQDVRALGFLRPPWGYAYDQLLGMQFDAPSRGSLPS